MNGKRGWTSGRIGSSQGPDHPSPVIPNFRNLGVVFKVLVLGELINVVALFAHAPEGRLDLLANGVAPLGYELTLLTALGLVVVAWPFLTRRTYRQAVMAVVGIAAVTAATLDLAMGALLGPPATAGTMKAAVVGAIVAGVILAYFDWRQRVLSPALIEARLEALQARIRPHFLFNSLNAAIAVLREKPRLAESVLLDMADLFRVVLAEPRALVPLGHELRVARAYLEIEQVRLGERLKVRWMLDDLPEDALVPVLMLQPLLENAVWHGIEPLQGEGEVGIRLTRSGRLLELEVSNPLPDTPRANAEGHRIALANIEERLALHFDDEARLTVSDTDGRFVVRVRLPIGTQTRA